MENSNSKPQDCYLRGVPTNVPNTVGSWLKRPDTRRADAVRKRGDAFPESATPLPERVDRRR
jgi:hypothetical protein